MVWKQLLLVISRPHPIPLRCHFISENQRPLGVILARAMRTLDFFIGFANIKYAHEKDPYAVPSASGAFSFLCPMNDRTM